MKILIAHIPPGTERQDLMNHVTKAVKSPWLPFLQRNCTVSKCKMIRILDLDTGGIEYHALVDIYPERAAKKAIQRLNGKPLNGQQLAARRWVDRTLVVGDQKQFPSGQSTCKRRKNLEITVA